MSQPNFVQVLLAIENQNITELKRTLKDVKQMPPQSIYDQVEVLLADTEKQEFVDLLLGWGDAEHKFQLLRAAAGRVTQEKETLNQLAMDICVKIVAQSPEIISVRMVGGPHPTVLHIAALAQSPDVVDKIFEIAPEKDSLIQLLDVRNKQGLGKTPLRVAVEARFPCLVRRILQLDKSPISDPALLNWALSEQEASDVLLVLIEERPEDMTETVVEYALKTKDDKLIKALQDSEECHRLFENQGFLHNMVQRGEVTMVDKLVDKFPKLVLELNNEKLPILSYNHQNRDNDREHIRNKIVPLITRQISSADLSQYRCLFPDDIQRDDQPNPLASEVIRALIARPSEKRKEISLSLGGFGSWASSAQSFLSLIRRPSSQKNITQPKEQSPQALLQVDFEHTLIYVDIPVSDLPVSRGTNPTSLTRFEVWEILSWLKNDKKVRGIYELSVRDSCYLSHTEHVIRLCLKGFDVEVLDWRRLDLSLSVLHEHKDKATLVCPNLKTLRLYAGSWPAIAYWTSEESLSFLNGFPRLTQVDIFILGEFIGAPLIDAYQEEAKLRFDDFKRVHSDTKLDVRPTSKSWSDLNPDEGKRKVQRETTAVGVTGLHHFLEAYDRLHDDFARPEWRSDPERLGLAELDPTGQQTPYVKVAVIDNGVDPGSINCHSIDGASFVPSETGESNWWYIRHAHGTKMARIIADLNPKCHLLVAKVCEGRTDATASRVIKAINWAVEAGAVIVSLSLTLDEDNAKLKIAINDAVARGVVIMASIRGEGNDGKGAGFPAAWGSSGGIRGLLAIASADAWGAPSKGTVNGQARYLFPGEKIVARTEFLGGLEDMPDISGPSVATAVAAGVASLVLSCDRFALLDRRAGADTWKQHEKLRVEIVDEIFGRMKDKGCVCSSLFFVEDKGKPALGEGDSVLKWISEKFRNILS